MSYRSRDGTLKPRKNKSQAGQSDPPNDSEDEVDKVFYDMAPLSEEKMNNMQKMIKNPKQK